MTKIEIVDKIRQFGEFSISEVEAIASAYMNDTDCSLEAVIDLAIGWGVPTREAVKRIVEG